MSKTTGFYCEKCNFQCNKQSNWNTHISTRKHIENQTPKLLNNFTCKCGKIYTYASGLSRHKSLCKNKLLEPEKIINLEKVYKPILIEPIIENTIAINNQQDISSLAIIDKDLLAKLLEDNKEFKTLLLQQNQQQIQQNQQQLQQNQDFQNKFLEIASKPTTTNTTNNNSFNLNLFLNETCKNAIDINEFLSNLDITYADFERVGKNGYVDGITNIIMKQLKLLEVNKRPIHCTDLKREVIYIRNSNKWNKDSENNETMRKVINCVANRNYNKVIEWSEQTPNSQDPEHDLYTFLIKAKGESLGDLGEEQTKLENKIIKTVAKYVNVDK